MYVKRSRLWYIGCISFLRVVMAVHNLLDLCRHPCKPAFGMLRGKKGENEESCLL